MKTKLALTFLTMTAALTSSSQAAVLSINDRNVGLSLTINGPWRNATPPNITDVSGATTTGNPVYPPGSGYLIDIANGTSAYGVNAVSYNGDVFNSGPDNDPSKLLSFTYVDTSSWGQNALLFRYFKKSDDNGTFRLTDLFVIQGIIGTTNDYISFISSDHLTGLLPYDLSNFGITDKGGSRTNLGTATEIPAWQLAADTGHAQYYIGSVPEPATLSLLGLCGVLIGFRRHNRA